MNKLMIAILTAAFAASPAFVAAQTTAPAKDEKKAEAKKDEKKAEEKKAEEKKAEKKKPKGGC